MIYGTSRTRLVWMSVGGVMPFRAWALGRRSRRHRLRMQDCWRQSPAYPYGVRPICGQWIGLRYRNAARGNCIVCSLDWACPTCLQAVAARVPHFCSRMNGAATSITFSETAQEIVIAEFQPSGVKGFV